MAKIKRTEEQYVEEIAKYLAWNIRGADSDCIEKLLEFYGAITAKERKNIMHSEAWKQKIENTRSYYNSRYMLYPFKIWETLWEIRENDFSLYQKINKACPKRSGFYYTENNIDEDQCAIIRENIFLWANTHAFSTSFNEVHNNPFVIEFFANSFYCSQWDGILKHLTPRFRVHVVNKITTLVENSFLPELVNKHLLSNIHRDQYNISEWAHILSNSLMLQNVLPGKINDYELNDELITFPNSFYFKALQLQYAGDYKKALANYRKGIKIDENGLIPSHPFYAMTYILALKEEKKESSLNALLKIQKKTTPYPSLIHVLLLLAIILEKNTEAIVQYFINNPPNILPTILFTLIAKHYNVPIPEFYIQGIPSFINNDNFKLLQLEASTEFPQFQALQQELIAELKIKPLLKKHVELSVWEKVIDEVEMHLNSLSSKSLKGPKSKVAHSRIYYLVNKDGWFTPRLQTTSNGTTWTKGRNIALQTFKDGKIEAMTEVDRKVAALVTAERASGWYGHLITCLHGPEVFAELINHPLVFQEENPEISVQITQGELHLEVLSSINGYILSSNITKEIKDPIVVVAENDVLYKVFNMNNIQYKIAKTLCPKTHFPLQAKEQLCGLLTKIAPHITVHSDLIAQSSDIKKMKADDRITVQLLPIAEGIKAEFFVKPFVESTPYCKAGEGNPNCMGVQNGTPAIAKRNLKEEINNYQTINAIFRQTLNDETIDDVVYFENYYACLEVIEQLQDLDSVVRLEWPKGAKLSIKKIANFDHIKLSVRGVGAWFEINGEVKVDKNLQISLAQLLEKNRGNSGRFVEISPNEYLALTNKLRSQLNELDSRLIYDKKKMQLSPYSSSIINELNDSGINVTTDKAFEKLQQQIEEAEQHHAEVPATLKTELREYQLDGFQWLAKLASWGAGACLADDMGLGKTVQSIALLLRRAQHGPALIVAPASVVPNWRNELRRFAPTLNCKVLHENIAARKNTVETAAEYDVIVTTYGLLNTENEILTNQKWDTVILDEAHNIKNRETKMSKAAMCLQAYFRLMLTGTPIQNHLGEIWNLFRFANPGLLGSFEYFTQKFIHPIEKENDKLMQKQLKKMLQPFLLRRTKNEVLDELPSKTEIIYEVELSAEERAHYENIRELAVANLEEGSLNPIQTLAEITKLRQAACHPALVNEELNLSSSKIAAFTLLVDNLLNNKHKALVFSQFTSFLKLIRKELDRKGVEYLYLDGSTPIKEREKLVNHFQHGNIPLFLISLKAGGTGLNLTAADYVIHLDPWWNPAIEDQATDRSHRIGQTNPVTIYKLIAKQTIEENIIALHKTKKSLADNLLEGSNLSHKLTRGEMLELLRGVNV